MSDDYRCPYVECGKRFASNKNLRDHIRTHTGEKPYKCKECGQGFAQYSTLHKHYRVHDKKRPYSCRFEGCDKSFTQISNRIRHERIHSGEKPFECAMCPKSFCSSSNLNQHLKVHRKQEAKKHFISRDMYYNGDQMNPIDVDNDPYSNYFQNVRQQPHHIYGVTNNPFSTPMNIYHSVPPITDLYCMCDLSLNQRSFQVISENMIPSKAYEKKILFNTSGECSAFTQRIKL